MRLENFVGNEPLVETLRRAGARLPPAMLFAGPEGVGKKTLALSLAALANCESPAPNDLCGRCASCIKAAAGYHPDILLFQPEKNLIRIKTMREMTRETHFRPFEGRIRFFIIDQAERMNESAANSILKTLEEPPESSRIVLISAFPRRLIPTVRSRCQTFLFQALGHLQIEAYLREQAVDAAEDAALRATFADGSIGKALVLDLEETIQKRDRVLRFITGWFERESFETIYRNSERQPFRSELKNREAVLRYLEMLTSVCVDLYFLLVGTPEQVVNRDLLGELQKLLPKVTLDWVRNLLYYADQSKWEIEHYVNPLMSFETLWLKSAYAGNSDRQV